MADEKSTRAEAEVEPPRDDSAAATGPDTAESGESAGPADAATLATELAEARELAESYKDRALRAQADAENTRRRAGRDVENAHKYALEKFTAELLPVLDSLERAVEVAAAADGAEAIAEGVDLSLKLFLSVLEKSGIRRLDPAGEPFDPQLHEAIAMVPSPHAEPNSVVDVMQKGYELNGRLVRAAKVVVARAPEG